MNFELKTLIMTAAAIGFFHTILGPDHYVPFIAMAKARKWSILKTSFITFLCGLGHVLGSVAIGMIGIIFGISVGKLEFIEAWRGDFAAWLLIVFGLIYLIWGIKAISRHQIGKTHNKNITAWTLFIIFVLGPCEPLIPILMYPAAKHNVAGVIMVTSVFSIITITTMLLTVLITMFNISLVPKIRLQKYSHAISGAFILFCGLGIKFLGF